MTGPHADYRLGPVVMVAFELMSDEDASRWCPATQVLTVDRRLHGRELAVSLLHEVGHMLCGDHADVLTDADHEWLEEWAQQSANLLDLVRPGRRAVPA